MNENLNSDIKYRTQVKVEYCGVCDYGGHCLSLARKIREETPDVDVVCTRGRQGSFEVFINEVQVYSKLQMIALPDFDEIVTKTKIALEGGEITPVISQQKIDCVIS